ncbi:MAG: AraC family transcriptional regulator [Paenibacillaceae bacterium]|jgi:AraC-like DNA-binding protein/mannose-6-phosphate isomerase-like protein (cupin superfamily)|nr:AraC family transcriptional regulator [Paenibacillaceae bacterium]
MKWIDPLAWTENCYVYQYRSETVNSAFHKFHSHQGLQFLYIHEGFGTIIIDGHIYQAQPGMLLVFQPYQLHRISMNSRSNGRYIRTVFSCEPGNYDDQLKPLGSLHEFFRFLWKGKLPVQAVAGLSEDDPVVRLFQYLHLQLEKTGEREGVTETTVFLINLLHQLRFRSPFADQLPKGEHPQRELHHVENIMQWVEVHYRQPFDLDLLAAELHLSPTYLSRLFRSRTGSSITEYMTAYRIHKACFLLRGSDYSVERITEEVGYGNTSYFCQLFKRQVGISPYQFRLQAKG